MRNLGLALLASAIGIGPLSVFPVLPAAAGEAADDASAAASAPSASACDMLEAAIARAQGFGDARYAFTVTRTQTPEDGEAVAIVAEFDPSWTQGSFWRVVSPDPETADKELRKGLKALDKWRDADAPVVYDGLADLADLTLAEETPDRAVFVTRNLGEDAPEDALEARLTLDKTSGHVSAIEVVSTKPFKPNAMVKITSHRQVEEFAAPEGEGPALIVRSSQSTEGSAAFNSFSMRTETVYADVRRVDGPPRESDD